MSKLTDLRDWWLLRLQESSTWRGLILIFSVLGAKLSPDHAEALIQAGLLLAGSVAITTKDKK